MSTWWVLSAQGAVIVDMDEHEPEAMAVFRKAKRFCRNLGGDGYVQFRPMPYRIASKTDCSDEMKLSV